MVSHCKLLYNSRNTFSSVQSLNCVRLFATPWTAAHRASLSITSSRRPPKPMSVELVMPSNHLILYCPFSSCPQSFPASVSFPMSQLFASGGQSIGVSASTSVLPMNTQDWSPLGWTGWIQNTLPYLIVSGSHNDPWGRQKRNQYLHFEVEVLRPGEIKWNVQ